MGKNTSGIQWIILGLLIGCAACSEEKDKVVDKSANKVVDVDMEKITKPLQGDIDATYNKYLEIDSLQQKLNDDIKTQLDSMTCSSGRLILLNNLDFPSSMAIRKLVRAVELLEIKENKTKKDSKFFYIITNRKYTYKYKTSYVPALVKCAEYYQRAIPNSKQARDFEAKAFVEEIARVIKRLNTFPQRFEDLERLASEATARQSLLQKRLDEYRVDANERSVIAGLDKYKTFMDEADKSLKQLNEMPDAMPTPAEVLFVEDIFK